MDENEKLIRVYTGTEITVKLLQAELQKNEISSIIENNFKSGVTAGFVGGMQSGTDLFIKAIDLEKSTSIINEFQQIND